MMLGNFPIFNMSHVCLNNNELLYFLLFVYDNQVAFIVNYLYLTMSVAICRDHRNDFLFHIDKVLIDAFQVVKFRCIEIL